MSNTSNLAPSRVNDGDGRGSKVVHEQFNNLVLAQQYPGWCVFPTGGALDFLAFYLANPRLVVPERSRDPRRDLTFP